MEDNNLFYIDSGNNSQRAEEAFIQGPVLRQQTVFTKSRQFLRQPKHENYVRNAKKRNYRPLLTPEELLILNDKLMNSSDEEQPEAPADQSHFLKFDHHKQRNYTSFWQTKLRKKIPIKDRIWVSIQAIKQKFSSIFSHDESQEHVKNTTFLFLPDSNGKLSWDLLCMILIFYEIITIPVRISFEVEFNAIWQHFVDITFALDILITFNTAIYKNGLIVFSRPQIAIDYLKLWFWLDLVASFPYDDLMALIMASEDSSKLGDSTKLLRLFKFFRFIKIVRLLRLAKLKVIFDKIEDMLQLSTTIAAIMSFIQLSVFVLFWSHWLGCIFHYVGISQQPNGKTVVIHSNQITGSTSTNCPQKTGLSGTQTRSIGEQRQ